MKQYKFKCPICGKWKDIRQQGEYFEADCICNLDFFEKFHVVRLGLAKLLSTLRKLNIEVAEVCDRLRFKNHPYAKNVKITQDVFIGKIRGAYYIEYPAYANNDSGLFSVDFYSAEKSKIITICKCKTLKSAKAACQDDFQKRRAK